ncbi:MAG: DNA translocase FtsK 4TM domain-containing protein, partial [Phycisphaerales bacterium]
MTAASFSTAGLAAPGVLTTKALKKGSAGVFHYFFIFAQFAIWTLVVLSVYTFNPADPPASNLSYPLNDPPLNACGLVGAYLGYLLLSLLGWGVYLGVALWAIYLFVSAFIRQVAHPITRALGVVLMCGATSTFLALAFPGSGPLPNLPGGVIGGYVSVEFGGLFGPFGTVIWMALAFLVGATIAVDVWVILAPLWAYRQARAAAGPTAAAAVTVAGATARSAGWMARVLAKLSGPESRSARSERLAGLKGLLDQPKRKGNRPGRKKDEDEQDDEIDESAGGLGGTESFDPEAHKAADANETEADIADEDTETEVPEEPAAGPIAGPATGAQMDAPSAKPGFDPAALRAKIAKLPIVFGQSAANKRSATEDDLRDIQSSGDLPGYTFPGLDLLEEPETSYPEQMERHIREQATALETALKTYGIAGEVVGMDSGPVITLYEVSLAPGTKVSALAALSSDIARALKAINIRVVPNTAGKDTIGIEVPN